MPDSTRQQLASNRKQNVACDACRSKKIRCARDSTTETCSARNLQCTSNYVESLAKVAVKRPRRAAGESNAEAGPSRLAVRQRKKTYAEDVSVEDEQSPVGYPPAGSAAESPMQLYNSQLELLQYLFSPYAVRRRHYEYNDLADIELCRSGNSDIWESLHGKVYDELPSAAHAAITGPAGQDLSELAEDLLETFLSIVHIRFPILDPDDIRSRFARPDTHSNGPLSHPLLAVALAFGARFSENPAIVGDRAEISLREEGERTRSRLVQLLVVRAREVCEVRKIHRIVTEENCATLILLEPLLGQSTFLKGRYQAYHAAAAGRHAASLGVTSRENLLGISDEKSRMQSVYMWWMTGLSDGWRSVFNKLKPLFDNDDFDVETPAFASGPSAAFASSPDQPSSQAQQDLPEPEQHDTTLVWFAAGNAGSFICRQLCHGLWTPRVHRMGISTATLRDFVHSNTQWRDKYIAKLGVPPDWPQEWDFLAAISSCSTEAYYHSLWMIVHQAIDEFGLEDEKNDRGAGASHEELEGLRRRIMEESEQSALKVASLISVLTENGYLRLDPYVLLSSVKTSLMGSLILSHPVYIAGLILARAGRPECKSCVAGLRQYSIAFGHLWEAADEVEQLYTVTIPSRATSFSVPTGAGGDLGGMSVNQVLAQAPGNGYESAGGMEQWHAGQAAPMKEEGEWNVTGAGAHLAASGFTSLPMVFKDGAPDGPTRDASVALFDWLNKS